MCKSRLLFVVFQSTLPVKGATQDGSIYDEYNPISIHAPREGSDYPKLKSDANYKISIHAPREGSDIYTQEAMEHTEDFNPRSP